MFNPNCSIWGSLVCTKKTNSEDHYTLAIKFRREVRDSDFWHRWNKNKSSIKLSDRLSVFVHIFGGQSNQAPHTTILFLLSPGCLWNMLLLYISNIRINFLIVLDYILWPWVLYILLTWAPKSSQHLNEQINYCSEKKILSL